MLITGVSSNLNYKLKSVWCYVFFLHIFKYYSISYFIGKYVDEHLYFITLLSKNKKMYIIQYH